MVDYNSHAFTDKAFRRWEKIPECAKSRTLSNVFYTKCCTSAAIILESASMQQKELILQGKCAICGKQVCRVVESEDD